MRQQKYFPATDIHLVGRKQLHRQKSDRQKNSEHRHLERRNQVRQTHEARSRADAQQLQHAIHDAFVGARQYTHHRKSKQSVEAELHSILNAQDDWKQWQKGERFGVYETPADIAAQEKALHVEPSPSTISAELRQQARERMFGAEAYGRHPKSGARGSVY